VVLLDDANNRSGDISGDWAEAIRHAYDHVNP
jgi:hypothetical protein